MSFSKAKLSGWGRCGGALAGELSHVRGEPMAEAQTGLESGLQFSITVGALYLAKENLGHCCVFFPHLLYNPQSGFVLFCKCKP